MAIKGKGKMKVKGKAPARSGNSRAWETSSDSSVEGLGLQMAVSSTEPALIDSATTRLQTGTRVGEGKDPPQLVHFRRLRLIIMNSSDEELQQLFMDVPSIQVARPRQAETMAWGAAPAQSPQSDTAMGTFQEKMDELLGLCARYYSGDEACHTRATNYLKVSKENVPVRESPSIAASADSLFDFDVKGYPASESTGVGNFLRTTPRRGRLERATHLELAEIMGSLRIGSNTAPNAGDGQQQRANEQSTQKARRSRSQEPWDSTGRSRWRGYAGSKNVRSLSPDRVLSEFYYSRTPSRSRSRDRKTQIAIHGNSCRGSLVPGESDFGHKFCSPRPIVRRTWAD